MQVLINLWVPEETYKFPLIETIKLEILNFNIVGYNYTSG